MKVPDFEPWAGVLLIICVPIIRGGWVVMWNEAARASFETGSNLFLTLAMPPLICGFVFWATTDWLGTLFQTLRERNASLITLTAVALFTSFLMSLTLIVLAGSYFGQVPKIFLSPTKADWEIVLNGSAVAALVFMLPFAAAIYTERSDRKNRE